MKKEVMIDGTKLFVARVRVVLRNDEETGARETAHYNYLGYRLFYKKDEENYIDILTRDVFPVLKDNMKEHQLFILNPRPFYNYASNLRIKESKKDVLDYAEFVADYFNKNIHNEKAWKETKNHVHNVHHKDDNTNVLNLK